jgi:nitrate reductase cytochrome c-type subunit
MKSGWSRRSILLATVLLASVVFLAWRFVRPMNIFVVSEAFERPIPTNNIPGSLASLSARGCATCHQSTYDEWSTTIHSQAWTDPYFQVDWAFDGRQQICKNCHIPLDRQQEHLVLGFNDQEKWQPILKANPDFDPTLQHEGVTCAACHLRDGEILGVFGSDRAPHPVRKIADSNEICLRCHVVSGKRWDTFFRFPPCGTVAEIETTSQTAGQASGTVLGCVQCHMPLTERPLVAGGPARAVRMHLWRGGHDLDTVKKGLSVTFEEMSRPPRDGRSFALTITNAGAAHYFPTGTPDRHLTVSIRLLDQKGAVLREKEHVLIRTIMWRPFIVDLWDDRLPRAEPRVYRFEYAEGDYPGAVAIEASVRYHLLTEARRRRIEYANKDPIAYDVYRARIALNASQEQGLGHE